MGQSPGRWYPKPAWTPQSIQQTVGPLFLTSSTCPAYDSSPPPWPFPSRPASKVLLTAKKTRSVAGKKLAKLEASAAGFGKWSSKSNIFPTYLFPLVLGRLLPKKQFCTCQLSRCACHASRGCCSSHVDGGHISTAAKPKNKSQKNKKEQHTELLQRGARRKGQTKWIKMVSNTFPALNHMDPYGYRNWRLAPKSATSGWIQPSFPCSRPNGWSSACHRCPFCSRDSCAPQWQRLVLLQDSHRKNSRKHKVEVSLQEAAWHVQLNSKPFRHLIAFKAPPLTPGAAKHHTPQLPPPDSPLGSKRTLSPLWHGWPKLTQIYILIFCSNFELAADKDKPCRHSLMREPLPALSWRCHAGKPQTQLFLQPFRMALKSLQTWSWSKEGDTVQPFKRSKPSVSSEGYNKWGQLCFACLYQRASASFVWACECPLQFFHIRHHQALVAKAIRQKEERWAFIPKRSPYTLRGVFPLVRWWP